MSELPEAISYHLGIPTPVLMSWLALSIVTVLSIAATFKIKLIPGVLQNAFEFIFEFIIDLVDSIMGEEGKHYYPFFIGLFLYIFFCNLLGLIPGLISPTANLNTTLALALIVFFSTHFIGIKRYGLVKYIKSLTGEVPLLIKPLMFVIELVSHLARPLSLSLRLFGNMVAKEILLGVLAALIILLFPSANIMQKAISVVPIFLLPFIYLLGSLIVFIQAFVFMVLSIFYIYGAVALHGEDSEHE